PATCGTVDVGAGHAALLRSRTDALRNHAAQARGDRSTMMATLLKFLHIAAISVWAAGLICFPFLNRQLAEVHTRTQRNRLHSMARFFYVIILSPAAFIAIGTGIALIFQQRTFTLWFSIKLLLVGLLAILHLLTG